MADFTLITSNVHKIAEFKRLIPDTLSFDIQSPDIHEIQSLDLKEIVKYKAIEAYKVVSKPVVVEDVSAGLDDLGGLPGPFVKYFENRLGPDALYKLGGKGAAATITCTIAYYDGNDLFICTGIIEGKIKELSPNPGFGFDRVFAPNETAKTFADIDPKEKDKISHRRLAVDQLVKYLNDHL
jgi:non-canonical purine NTP pyrophosphatase (RdgB/HAM1 family)